MSSKSTQKNKLQIINGKLVMNSLKWIKRDKWAKAKAYRKKQRASRRINRRRKK